MAISRTVAQCLTVLMFLAMPSITAAQRPIPIPKDQISSAGKIKAVQNGVFHVANVGGDQWLLKIEAPANEIVLKGKATPEWLRPGMPVTFRGTFFKNKSGQPQGEAQKPIDELKVFSLREDSKAGQKEEAKRGSFLTGGPKKDTPMESAPFTVTGILVKYKGGKMTVSTGETQIKAQVASDAKIDVDINDARFAREGDEIEFEGWHYVGQKEQIHATKVWITAAQPLGEQDAKRQTIAKSGQPTPDGGSEEQQTAARQIQIAIGRARKLYDAGDYPKAAGAVESIITDWNALFDSNEAVAGKLLQPRYKQLKLVHAFLEMEGVDVPALRELPEAVATP